MTDDDQVQERTPVLARYDRVAGRFAARVREVPPEAWDAPTPCEGWVARDIVRHLLEWVPGLLDGVVEFPPLPSVDDDPVRAWDVFSRRLREVLADPALRDVEFDSRGGRVRVEDAIANFCIGDISVHTWDLARAAGLDDTLEPAEVRGAAEALAPMDEVLRSSGHFGPKVAVASDADDQTKLLAFMGRDPNWRSPRADISSS